MSLSYPIFARRLFLSRQRSQTESEVVTKAIKVKEVARDDGSGLFDYVPAAERGCWSSLAQTRTLLADDRDIDNASTEVPRTDHDGSEDAPTSSGDAGHTPPEAVDSPATASPVMAIVDLHGHEHAFDDPLEYRQIVIGFGIDVP